MTKNKSRRFHSIITLFLLCSPFSLLAEENDLLSLSLKELLNIKVSVASLNEEEISNTPAIVSRYSRDDLNRLGLHSLKELLSFIPGVLANDGTIGNTFISVRGLHEDFNQKNTIFDR